MATATITTSHSSVTAGGLNLPPAQVPSGPVSTPINFFVPPADGAIAQYLVDGGPDGKTVQNYDTKGISVQISDIRDQETSFNIGKDAFEALSCVQSDSSIDWTDDRDIKSKYYPEVEQLLRDSVAGVRKIVIFDHTIRLANPTANRQPVLYTHVDQTPYSTAQRVRRHVSSSEEAEELLKGRYRIINVWRPLTRGPVCSHPLAFASASSTSASDIVPIQHVYPDGYIGEHAGVVHNSNQQWYYWSAMTGDERILLQCFDSNLGEKGGRTPHTAFVDPRTPENAEPRKSIEVRALVFG